MPTPCRVFRPSRVTRNRDFPYLEFTAEDSGMTRTCAQLTRLLFHWCSGPLGRCAAPRPHGDLLSLTSWSWILSMAFGSHRRCQRKMYLGLWSASPRKVKGLHFLCTRDGNQRGLDTPQSLLSAGNSFPGDKQILAGRQGVLPHAVLALPPMCCGLWPFGSTVCRTPSYPNPWSKLSVHSTHSTHLHRLYP